MRALDSVAAADPELNVRSFVRHLRAANLAPTTIEVYGDAARQLTAFLAEAGTANNRLRALQQFFKWLHEEGEIDANPMERMPAPRVPEVPVPVVPDAALKRLLATCDPATLEGRRDLAILRTFIDTGARLREVADLRYTPGDDTTNDVDLDQGLLRVLGKGRLCFLPIGPRTVRAIDRYVRLRVDHPAAEHSLGSGWGSAATTPTPGSKSPHTSSAVVRSDTASAS